VLLSEIIERFQGFWPEEFADEWDRVGLIVGDPSAQVTKVLVSVDLTEAVIEEAQANNCQLILTHHPALLKAVNYLAETELKGRLVALLNRARISNFAAHTNADVQSDGASSVMARRFGLLDLEPLVEVPGSFGHGVIGALARPITLRDFANMVAANLPNVARKISFAGDPLKLVSKVAVCSGAGESFLPTVIGSDADVYVTSDLRHHPTLDSVSAPRRNGKLSLIDVSHFAAESLWVESACERLKTISELEVLASLLVTDPWTEEVGND
jgi:dinuclear metal center YbgI/SA1388 family protein